MSIILGLRLSSAILSHAGSYSINGPCIRADSHDVTCVL